MWTYLAKKTQRIARTDRSTVKGQRYPLTYEGFKSSWAKLCDRQEVKGVHPHVMRKTSGSRMLRVTGNINAVAKHLGQSDIRMTERSYAHIVSDDIRKAMERTDTHYEYGED